MIIKQRERTAILQSLAAGVVPKIGLHHIQVGRKLELEALISDLMNIEDCGATVRFVIGRFG
ncbi:MAG: ATP-binding protein, partial [Alphaproteobacteria bacterium]